MPVLKDYLSINEAAEILGIHPGTVKRLCREHKLSAHKVHNGWLIHIDDIQSFSERYEGRRGRPSNRIVVKRKAGQAIYFHLTRFCLRKNHIT